MGADVTHPAPDQMGLKPSIAAVVASVDPCASKYHTQIKVQFNKDKNAIEEITAMEEITRELLMRFYQNSGNKYKPERIIFYRYEKFSKKKIFLVDFFEIFTHLTLTNIIDFRDGVSEGQFEMVVNKEISAIQRACKRLEKDYEPKITYFVAQKRHHTRFFPPENSKDKLRNGNVMPGTVVDTDVTHPTVSSFYLASQEGIQVHFL